MRPQKFRAYQHQQRQVTRHDLPVVDGTPRDLEREGRHPYSVESLAIEPFDGRWSLVQFYHSLDLTQQPLVHDVVVRAGIYDHL